jgi:hypothetical protein
MAVEPGQVLVFDTCHVGVVLRAVLLSGCMVAVGDHVYGLTTTALGAG